MEYSRKQINSYEIFDIKGEFITQNTKKIYEEYSGLINNKKCKFIFDLTKVKYIDSEGLGIILLGAKHVKSSNNKIKICLDTKNFVIKTILKNLNIDSIVEFYSSLDDALESENKIMLT